MIKKKAFGLVEVLIGLAVFGTLLISATSITIRSFRIVKDNEIADFANGIMIASLEKVKSDSSIGLGTLHDIEYYQVTGSIGEYNEFKLDYDPYAVLTSKIEVLDCEDQDYQLDTSAINQVPICNQIIIEKIGNNHLVTSRIIYRTATDWHIVEASGFKINVY